MLLGACVPVTLPAQQGMGDVEITTVPLRRGMYMLQGRGGNIGLSVGADGAFLVDDQYAPLTEKILAAIRAITPAPVRFVINTHWHGDHTGGNENLGKAGAIIVAHENVRERLKLVVQEPDSTPLPAAALPVVTFNDAVTFYWNGEEIHVFHVHPAHTDGDAVIHFRNADVIHMGDLFFNGRYPFIDVASGGSVHGLVSAADQVLALSGPGTQIIPGHGALASAEELRAYRDMLIEVRNRIAKLIAEGRTREEIIATKPTADLDPVWGGGFISGDRMVGQVYDSLLRP